MKLLRFHVRPFTRVLPTLLAAMVANACAPQNSPSSAATAPQVKRLLSQPHPRLTGYEIAVVQVDFPPGASSRSHSHPGIVVGNVVSGELDFQIKGSGLQHLKEGDVFYEPEGSEHLVSRNPSATLPTRVIAFMEQPKGSPLVIPLLPSVGAKKH